jgi:lysophospholipase L1-like esterase
MRNPVTRRALLASAVLTAMIAGGAVIASTGGAPDPADPAPRFDPAPPVDLAAPDHPATPATRILVIGDSIMALQGRMPRLRELLDAAGAGYELHNAGTGGISTRDVVAAAPQLVNAFLPDLIVHAIGTNDEINGFEERYRRCLDTIFKWKPDVVVVPAFLQYAAIPPAPPWLSVREKNDAIYRQTFPDGAYRPGVVGFARFDQIPQRYLDPSGFHPSPAGCVKVQEQIYRGLQESGRLKLPPLPADAMLGTGRP